MENTSPSNVRAVLVGDRAVATFTAMLVITTSSENSPPPPPRIPIKEKPHHKAEKLNRNLSKPAGPRPKSLSYKRENFNYNKGRKN